MPGRRLAVLAAVAGAALFGLAGCGLRSQSGSSAVTLLISRDFGRQMVQSVSEAKVPSGQTALALLRTHGTASTAAAGPPGSGRVVTAIGATAAGGGRKWFLFVNGIGTTDDPAKLALHPGDEIWWDFHDASQRSTDPAVVGRFPEPFVHGYGGKRYPVVIECGSGLQATCDRIASGLHRYGVAAPSQLLGGGSGSDSIGVLVGTWPELRPLVAGAFLAKGPRSSGVYARFAAGGRQLELLDSGGGVARTLGPGAGLIAATRDAVSQPVWVIAGTDAAGVDAAAGALSPARLRDHFALAVAGGTEVPLPVAP